jgi:4-hydroxy-tetrahydrodipicolinate reductase
LSYWLIKNNIGLCLAANFSTGVNLCFKLLDIAARVLGNEVDVGSLRSPPSPQGRLSFRHRICAWAKCWPMPWGRDPGQGCRLMAAKARSARANATPSASPPCAAATYVGDHTVMFMADGERVEITHKASSRLSFARGAVRAAQWLVQQKPGLYDMQDVLSLR